MVFDIAKAIETNVTLIKLIILTLELCNKADIDVKVVANPKQATELKSFQETNQILPFANIEEALAAM